MQELNNLLEIMQDINYGFPDENKNNMQETDFARFDNEKEFEKFYYLLSPEELYECKCGTCFDQVELARDYLEKRNIKVETYYICYYHENMLPTHTFLVVNNNHKYYWFEHAWGIYQGIHEYASLDALLKDVKNKFLDFSGLNDDNNLKLYRYNKPNYHLSYAKFTKFCEESLEILLK